MRNNFSHHSLLIRWLALALASLLTIAGNSAAAQSSHALYQDIFIPTGLARGQTLRYTWANLNDPDPQKREFEPLRIEVKLIAADGSVIAQTEAPAVGVSQSQSFNFNRDQINWPGEPGTGRLQFCLKVRVHYQMGQGASRYEDLTLNYNAGMSKIFEDAAEIIDTFTGRTTVLAKPKEIVVVGSKITQR